MKNNVIETIVGAVVLLVAAVFLVIAYRGSEMGVASGDGYTVQARFADATGINVGSDVRLGGIKIGTVEDMGLDAQSFEAVTSMHIGRSTPIPSDSSAAIASAGLLGEKFVQITPGGDEQNLADGGQIQFTQSSVSLEELIGKFVFSGGGVEEEPSSGLP